MSGHALSSVPCVLASRLEYRVGLSEIDHRDSFADFGGLPQKLSATQLFLNTPQMLEARKMRGGRSISLKSSALDLGHRLKHPSFGKPNDSTLPGIPHPESLGSLRPNGAIEPVLGR